MLVTHLAMALTRSQRGAAPAGAPPAALVDEVRAHEPEVAFVRSRLDGYAAALGVALPEAEHVFVAAHLCSVTLPA